MDILPLAIIQARMGSTRLPGKMLLPVNGEPLVVRVWRLTCRAVGPHNVIVAVPGSEENRPLLAELARVKADVFVYAGPENDVLGRFHQCAHTYRWHPDSVILRVTADDPWKDPSMMKRVIGGERLPVELGGEAFTLRMLDLALAQVMQWSEANPWERGEGQFTAEDLREHLTYAIFAHDAPSPPDLGIPWSIDTQEEYDAVVAVLKADQWPDPSHDPLA